MPNRIIKESIKRSPQIDQLSWFEEVVFYRLIVTVDDYGCYDGRTVVLKNDLFPAKDNITKKSIEDALEKLIRIGLVERYVVDELPIIRLLTWEKHQRMDKAKRKYPPPLPQKTRTNTSASKAQDTVNKQTNISRAKAESYL